MPPDVSVAQGCMHFQVRPHEHVAHTSVLCMISSKLGLKSRESIHTIECINTRFTDDAILLLYSGKCVCSEKYTGEGCEEVVPASKN